MHPGIGVKMRSWKTGTAICGQREKVLLSADGQRVNAIVDDGLSARSTALAHFRQGAARAMEVMLQLGSRMAQFNCSMRIPENWRAMHNC